MKFMRTAVKYMWQDYNTNEYILSELKINPDVKKIQNYRNKWTRHVRPMDRDAELRNINRVGNEGKVDLSIDFQTVTGTGTVTGLKSYKL